MSELFKINGHGHLLPYPEQTPRFMKEQKIFWVDADRKFMRQDNWQRPITDPSFFLKEKLEWMERSNIQHEVILNLSQLYCNGFPKDRARDVIRFQNDFNAGVQHEHPTKFSSGFVIQPAYVDDALAEMDRCINELGLSMMCLPTHFLDTKGNWCSVAHRSVEPIFQMAHDNNLAVQIHPYDGQKIIGLKDMYWRFHLVWMCALTADTYHLFTLMGYPQIYHKMRVSFAHGNQFGQVNVGRRVQGFEGRPDLFEGTTHPDLSLQLSNMFFDTLVHDMHSFQLLIARQSSRQVIAGLDDPYPLGEMEGVAESYPGRVIDEAVDYNIITAEERQHIWRENVMEWFCGDTRKAAFMDRIGLVIDD
jgi:aminocarboxymuconate-semialdehyde decarboxylase